MAKRNEVYLEFLKSFQGVVGISQLADAYEKKDRVTSFIEFCKDPKQKERVNLFLQVLEKLDFDRCEIELKGGLEYLPITEAWDQITDWIYSQTWGLDARSRRMKIREIRQCVLETSKSMAENGETFLRKSHVIDAVERWRCTFAPQYTSFEAFQRESPEALNITDRCAAMDEGNRACSDGSRSKICPEPVVEPPACKTAERTISYERAMELLDAAIEHASVARNTKETIRELSRIGFTRDEMICLRYDENDIREALGDETDK